MKKLRMLHLIFPLLVVLPSLGEAGRCSGALTLEQWEVCKKINAHNAQQYKKGQAGVREAERRLQVQREAQLRAAEQERLRVKAEQDAAARQAENEELRKRRKALERPIIVSAPVVIVH